MRYSQLWHWEAFTALITCNDTEKREADSESVLQLFSLVSWLKGAEMRSEDEYFLCAGLLVGTARGLVSDYL